MKEKKIQITSHITDELCPYCKKNGYDIKMELLGNHISCPLCGIGRLISVGQKERMFFELDETYDKNEFELTEYVFFPPHKYNSFLNDVLSEARKAILCGLYYPAILTIGGYVELLLKEIIFINDGKRLKDGLDRLLNYSKSKKYISSSDYDRLNYIRKKCRNPFAHGDTEKIMGEGYVKVTCYMEPKENESLQNWLTSNDHQQRMIKTSDMSNAFFSASYDTFIRDVAIELYNEVYDVAVGLTIRYVNATYVKSEFNTAFDNSLSIKEFEKMTKGKDVIVRRICDKKTMIAKSSFLDYMDNKMNGSN